MIQLKNRLQKLRDLQERKHQKYLETKRKMEKYQSDSFRLIWKIEQTKDKLIAL
jgi:hypothetical protein